MNIEFSFTLTEENQKALNEILKQQGLRHFKLYTDFYGELDVVSYEEYQKIEKEKDKYKNIIDELAIWLINQSKDYKGITKYDKCLEKLNELEDEK